MVISRITGLFRRLRRDRRGNVLMIFGFTLLPLTFATGMGIDYARAMRLQTKLDAAADAAALGSVSKVAMSGGYVTTAMVQVYATQLFMAQTQGLVGAGGLVINYADTTQLKVTVADSTSNTTTKRTATVTYRAQSSNAFASILGMPTLTIKGTSQSTASTAPNIDFYVMMDTSPSMLLPATSAGLSQMIALSGNNCAFACHITGSTTDTYSKARNNNIVLRTDLVSKAIGDLTTTATKMASINGAAYRMGLMDFDYSHRQIWPTVTPNYWVDNDLNRVKSHVADAVVPSYCSNGDRECSVSPSLGDNDTATSFTNALNGANAKILDPGDGSNQPGQKPQAILFIITDGMRDEAIGDNVNNRIIGPIPTALCDTIKNRNIRIAILNTQYLPESASDSWSVTNVKTPFLSPTDKITPALTACASPGLFYQVTTDDDVSAALAQLFQQAVASAHIIQ